MAARKGLPKAAAGAASPPAAAEGPTSKQESAPESAPEPVAKPSPARRPVPPHPVKRYQVNPKSPLGSRVGGFVLTERGWVRDAEQE